MQPLPSLRSLLAPVPAPAALRQCLGPRFWLAAALAWAASVGLRLMELGTFLDESFLSGGERMLATHDGYAFLAGAQLTSRDLGEPLARALALLHAATGIALGDLGFWLPPLAAGLAALPLCLAAARAGRPEAGAVAGLVAASCFGFFIRSRIGFLDTDMLSLFFACAMAAGLYVWLVPQCRPGWLPGGAAGPREGGGLPLHLALAGGVLLGLLALCSARFYVSGRPLLLAMIWGMGALGLLLARPGQRTGLLLGLAALLGIMEHGWPALAAGLALAALAWKRPQDVRAHHLGAVAGCVALAALGATSLLPRAQGAYNLLLVYLDPTGAEVGAAHVRQGLALPSVISTVRETASVGWANMQLLVGGAAWLFWAGLAGYVLAVVLRPLLLAFAPLLGLGLASLWLGTRFAMYGGAAIGLGLGLLVADLAAAASRREVLRLGAQGVLLAACLLALGLPARGLPPQRVLSPVFADTLRELDTLAAPDAVLWQWWDYGYAAQYYARRETFGDGGRHSGGWIYPLALAHASTSPAQAAGIIAYTGADMAQQIRLQKASGKLPRAGALVEFFSVDPVRGLAEMGGEAAMAFVERLAVERPALPVAPPEQYLVLAWENMAYLGVISTLGNRSLATGAAWGGKSSPLPGAALDLAGGALRAATGRTAQLAGLTLVEQDGSVRTRDWLRPGAPFAVVNRATGEAFIMEARVYNSMMVRMLLDDPREFEPHFTLVVDNGPWCRAYRVN
ncbi:STT3 domain-containing protein [Desulfocurvus vexinensis]|uniref:STT3 domain-containing protein n=1 Tax=Desulfocurvus vexinensis TaxID=399548 RepID=UPI0004B09AEC|nr:STT3 domain-containing protein [Desulfocurvus vexinensis]